MHLGIRFAQHVDLFPRLTMNLLERLLQQRILRADFCFPDVSWPLLISLEADCARNIEDNQAGVVGCMLCQIQQPAASKIVEGRAVRYGETPQLQSFLNNKMEEIKREKELPWACNFRSDVLYCLHEQAI